MFSTALRNSSSNPVTVHASACLISTLRFRARASKSPSFATSCTRFVRSNGAGEPRSTPLSMRVSASNWPIKVSRRRASSPIRSRFPAASSAGPCFTKPSATIRRDNGERNSCETSASNRPCPVINASIRSAMRSKLRARSAISSRRSRNDASTRVSSRPSAMFAAASPNLASGFVR